MNVGIWDSPWIPLQPGFKPKPNPNLIGLLEFCVADLISSEDRSWNRHLMEDLFDSTSVQCILSIHLPQINSFDKWIWAPSSAGLFSVKSAHELSFSSGGGLSPLSSEAWHTHWGLKLQARLKHLLWKIAWNILPTWGNIGRFVTLADVEA